MIIIRMVAQDEYKSNTYLLINESTTILIDCGVSPTEIKNYYYSNTGRELTKIDAVFITHGHFDHISTLDLVIKKWNPVIYASGLARVKFKNAKLNLSSIAKREIHIDPIERFIAIKDGDRIKTGLGEVQVIATPGHSDCSCCFLLNKVLFSGDTIFKTTIGTLEYLTANPRDMKNTLMKLKEVDFEIGYPGHYTNFSIKNIDNVIGKYIKYLL